MEFTGISKENYRSFQPLLFSIPFSEGRIFTGAVKDQEAACAAVFSGCGDVLSLEWIYVPEKMRRQGIATALLLSSLEEIRKLHSFALYVSFPDYRQDLISFFDKLGFRRLRDGECFSVPAGAFLDSKPLQALFRKTEFGDVVSLSDLTFSEWELLEEAFQNLDLDPAVVHFPEVDRDLSFVEMDPDSGLPETCILAEQKGDTTAILLLANFSHEPEDLLALFSALCEQLKDRVNENNRLVFLTMDDGMKKLAKKLSADPSLIGSSGTVVSCSDVPIRERAVEKSEETLSEIFTHPEEQACFDGSWIQKHLFPEKTPEEPEEKTAEDLFRDRAFALSHQMKRGFKFQRKAKLQDQLFQILEEITLSESESMENGAFDYSVFEYHSDHEFLEKFSKTYPLLQQMLSDHPEDPMLAQVAEDYENQLVLMESPYYVLFAGKDTAKLSEKHIEAIEKNLEIERQNGVTQASLSAIEAYLEHLKESRTEGLFGKGKKVTNP